MNQADLINAIYREQDRAVDYANTQLREIRKKAWDRVLHRYRGDETTTKSTVQATTIRDQGYALLAAIMPAYNTDRLISFPANGPQDADQADAEAAAVNAIFCDGNDGYLNLHNAVADALWFRNGVIKVWVEDYTDITTRSFMVQPGQTAQMFILTMASSNEEWNEIESDDPDLITFEITVDKQRVHIDSIEPAYFYCDPNQSDQNLQNANFLSERAIYTRSELVSMGMSKKQVYELPAIEDESITTGIGSSNTDITAKFIDGVSDVGRAATPDNEQVECYWCHMLIDTDGDGISERWRFLVSNRELLNKERVEFWPYASGTGWPIPHRWSGLGLYDLLADTEMQQTNARRQLADNLNMANNQRPVFDSGTTNVKDIVNSEPGRGIDSRDPGSVHFMPVHDVVSNSISFLQYMDEIKSEQAGGTLALQSGDVQSMAQISGISAEMQLAPREAMAAQVSTNLAETLVRQAFLILHDTLRTYWKGEIQYMKAGEWQSTNPREWQRRTRIDVIPGLSPGQRRQQANALQQVIQMQLQLVQGGQGGTVTDLNGFHQAVHDWMSAMELNNTAGYFIDPDSQEGQQAQQMQMQSAQQQQMMQAQMMQMQIQLEQQKLQLEQQKALWDKQNDDFDNETDRLKLGQELEIKEAELYEQARQSEAAASAAGRAGSDQSNAQ